MKIRCLVQEYNNGFVQEYNIHETALSWVMT